MLPPGWEDILEPQPRMASPQHRYSELSVCFCGMHHSSSSKLCNGIAVDSAYKFHHYLSEHRCPVIPVHSLGNMDRVCSHCHAQFFPTETVNCCMRGTIAVPIPSVPTHLHAVITSRAVLGHIRQYNMALSMASTGHLNLSPDWGMFVFGGKSYHRLSERFFNPSGPPAFAQIYMLDTAAATSRRLELFSGSINRGVSLSASILAQLHELLMEVNPWIGQFRSAGLNVTELVWNSCGRASLDGMGLGAMVDGYGKRNIIIRICQGDALEDTIRNIDDEHELYHPLAYVLLFPTGEGGWASWMSRQNHDGSDAGKMTLTMWARYIIMRRIEGPSHLQCCGVLTSEF